MYIDKKILVTRIKNAAMVYKYHLAGKTFMFVYENECFEIIFKNSNSLFIVPQNTHRPLLISAYY